MADEIKIIRGLPFRIYETKQGTWKAYYNKKVLHRATRANLMAAMDEYAQTLLGITVSVKLSQIQSADYHKAMELLAPFGVTLSDAARFYAEATLSLTAAAQETYDLTIDKLEKYGNLPKGAGSVSFKLWVPNGETPKYVLFLVAYHGKENSQELFDKREFKELAERNNLAVLTFIFDCEDNEVRFDRVEQWSGKLTFDALTKLATQAGKPELGKVPLLIYGVGSAATVSNFAAWNPKRVSASVSNTGIVFNNPASPENAYKTSFLIFENDTPSNKKTVDNLLASVSEARKRGALWCVAATVKSSDEQKRVLGAAFIGRVLSSDQESLAWVGNLKDKTIAPADADKPASTKDTVWLPDEDFAHTWQLFVGGKE